MKLIGKIILSLCIILFSFTVSQAEIAVYDANNHFIGYLLGTQFSMESMNEGAVQVYVPSLARIANLSRYCDMSDCPLGKLGIAEDESLLYETSVCMGIPYLRNFGDGRLYYIYCNSGKYYIADPVTLTSRTIYSFKIGYNDSCGTYSSGSTMNVVPVREVSLPFSLPLIQPLKFSIETPTNKKLFQWPVAPNNSSNGHYGPCLDSAEGCYWLGDSEDTNNVWRDAQPFQLYWWGNKGYHLGADYNLGSGSYDKGKLVYPAANGIISKVKSNQCSYGNIIFVRHNTSFGVYTSMYAHVDWLEGVPPQEGSSVTIDKSIARIGNGYWNNPNCQQQIGQWPYHLHFEIREGDNTVNGKSYTQDKVEKGPQGQIDPNAFISAHN